MSYTKWRPFCSCPNLLIVMITNLAYPHSIRRYFYVTYSQMYSGNGTDRPWSPLCWDEILVIHNHEFSDVQAPWYLNKTQMFTLSNTCWWHRFGSTLVQMPDSTKPLCEILLTYHREVLWYWPVDNFSGNGQYINHYNILQNYTCRITAISLRGQWVNKQWVLYPYSQYTVLPLPIICVHHAVITQCVVWD